MGAQATTGAHPDADIRVRYGGALEGVFDVSRVREALSNLVANVIQHGKDQSVYVSVDRDDAMFVVRVVSAGEIPEA